MLGTISIVFALTLLLAVAACGGAGTDPQRDAIRAVASSDLFSWVDTDSDEPGESDCEIPHGGPPPPDLRAEMVLDGICSWAAVRDTDGWLVTFTESWASAPDNWQWHSWTYRVETDGSVSRIDGEGLLGEGAIPPQFWQ